MGPAAVALFAGYQPAAGANKAMLSQNVKTAGRAPAWSTAGEMGFVRTNSSLPTMPWSAAPTADLLSMGLPSEFAAAPATTEVKPEAARLESIGKDKPDLVNLDDGFDDGILNLNVLTGSPIEGLMESLESDFTDSELMMTPRRPEPHMAPKIMTKPGEVKSRRLCKSEGCYKRSRSNGLCISHGGGRRCAVEGCDKSSQGGNLCIRHGGGKRCSHEGCDKAAQSNFLCKAHGRWLLAQLPGRWLLPLARGGKRCMFDGCDKGTQRGDYCALHGGSRLCEVPGCMRNDRGGGLCATHGGGKRCTVDACNKPCRRKGLCSAHLRQVETSQ
ncbi:hypothetical protein GQ600_18898 [Phytophthora cactorum]|nr:hypothetical protein GQ600_18898 [Phytophthora cactorum]